MTDTMNFLVARSTWLLVLTVAVQFGKALGFDWSFDAATDPDAFADAVSTLFAAWAAIERITGRKKLIMPWHSSTAPATHTARRSIRRG